jgi:hypothetical protein
VFFQSSLRHPGNFLHRNLGHFVGIPRRQHES